MAEVLERLSLSVILGAALGSVALAQGSARFDGQYVGELTLTQVIAGDCTTPPLGAAYPLTVSGGIVRFKYVPRFDTVLSGAVDMNGNFKASRHLHSGLVSMTGHIEGNNVTASIVSPSCRYSFRTKE